MQKIKHLFRKMFHGLHFTTPVAIIVAAIILAASHVGYGYILSNNTPTTPTTAFKGRAIDATDLMTGNTKSKVILVEYSDSQCPFCARLYPTMQQIEEAYNSKIGYVYRYFPLTQIHPDAFEEARSIYCVGKNLGAVKRKEYIDALFSYKLEKQNANLPKGQKEIIAKSIGVNEGEFATCMQSQESSDVVNASIQDGITAGVQGTPASYVLIKTKKGYETVSFIDGARPFEYFKAIIDDALSR
jgi:protein-disulfide isomerase